MTDIDYNKAGLKCGLEIHQQLEGRKLFSACPTVIRDDEPDGTIVRELRAVAGEIGQVDVAALSEARKQRKFVYEYYDDTVSLVELDEAPPLPMNQDALTTTLQLSKLVNAGAVDKVQVMRKTVVDGSNTSGFQRTALVARNGVMASAAGSVTIPEICLEEDAARIISQTADSVTYRLDRLGIPLIEISTGPDIKHPEQVTDVAERIGMLLRSTGKAKRGLGTIRQDLNVSIKGGTRVEIKGAQELKMLATLVKNEVLRQQALIALAKELKERAKEAAAEFKDVSSAFKGAQSKIIGKTLNSCGIVLGVRLPNAAGLLGKETQPGKRFGTELADAAKVAAGVKGIIHSDEELTKYDISEEQMKRVRGMLGCEQGYAFVLVAAAEEQAHKALSAVIGRYNAAFNGVPKEVRRANPDGTTSYLRPMPGAARMYPETDVPTMEIGTDLLESITVPERIDERASRYTKLGLSKDLADLVARSERWERFEAFLNKFRKLKTAYVAEVFFASAKTIKRQSNIDIEPSDEDFEALFSAITNGKIAKEAVLDILQERCPVAEVLDKYASLSDDQLSEALDELIKQNQGKPFKFLIGVAMEHLRGKAPGKKIAQLLKDKLKS